MVYVFIHYEVGDDANHKTLKIKIPKKWLEGPTENLKETFVEHYNGKFPDNQLDCEEIHFENGRHKGKAISSNGVVNKYINHKDDLYLVPGASPVEEEKAPKKAEEPAPAKDESKLRCFNFGCNQHFREEDNHDTACSFHVKPPMFHDVKKGWTCCPDKMVYDWDDFQELKGCTVGRHSSVKPDQVKFEKSPTVAAAERAEEKLKTADDFNSANPDAARAEKSAAKEMTGRPKPLPKKDGMPVCVNKGCRKPFNEADNSPEACSHHKSNPVFHDTGKWWACCPDRVAYDFDDFMKIEGCCKSVHWDATGDVLKCGCYGDL